MSSRDKANSELLEELRTLRRRVEKLEKADLRRNQAEGILQERELRYRRLIQFLTDYIYTVTLEGGAVVHTYHGPGCFPVTGYSSTDYDDDPDLWFRMVHRDDSDMVLEMAHRSRRGEDVPPYEHRIFHRDGTIRWIKNTIVLRKDDSGQMLSYDGLINDITDLKHAEAENRRKQEQLLQADRMASLGILVSGVAHEVNNPNNFILLNAQFMSEVWRDIQPVLKEYYQHQGEFSIAGLPYNEAIENIEEVLTGILKGSMRIKKIINNLKKFGRPDKGELTQRIRIPKMIRSAIQIIDNLIHNATIHFSMNTDSNLPDIPGNYQQLEQVIINLLTNACHALENRNQRISINTGYDVHSQTVRITVKDEGRGIPPENLNRIIDPFFTTKRDSEGTGLGLSISYQIIKNHGGDLRFISEVGKGTEAIVELPVPEAIPPQKT